MARRSLALVIFLLAACADRPTGHRLTGRLLDAETGAPVSRDTVWIHAFNDAIGHQVSLRPEDTDTFALEVPEVEVRLRVADKSRRYALFEHRVVLEPGTTSLDVALEPTHYVLLHGHTVDAETGRRVPRAEHEEVLGGPLLIYLTGGGRNIGPIWPDADGRYSERVPRERIKIQLVNTSESVVEDVVDLECFEEDEYEHDLRIR